LATAQHRNRSSPRPGNSNLNKKDTSRTHPAKGEWGTTASIASRVHPFKVNRAPTYVVGHYLTLPDSQPRTFYASDAIGAKIHCQPMRTAGVRSVAICVDSGIRPR